MGKKYSHPVLLGFLIVLAIFVSGVTVGLAVVALTLRFPTADPWIWLVAGTFVLLLLVAACRRALRSVIKE